MTTASAPTPASPAKNLLDHEYDGIREFDNPTPGWWHAIFVATMLFALLYVLVWHVNPMAPTNEEAWQLRQVAEYKRVFGKVGDLAPDEPTIRKMMADPQMQAIAQGIFASNCAACHARDGGGINCVNLTDDAYKNVKVVTDIFNVITKGANNGAMPTWEQRLSKNERIILAAYVANLRGTKPTAGKPPEGDVIPPWGPGK
jgi:cytochrome c oxidase cbb3-type subunit 3